MILIPIFDYKCKCGHLWENVEVWPSHAPKECPKCKSTEFSKIFTTIKHEVRMDPNSIRSMPDPVPPLTELKPQKGSESGLRDLQRTELKDYVRSRDKYGNAVWREKRRSYFHPGKHSKRSSEERNS